MIRLFILGFLILVLCAILVSCSKHQSNGQESPRRSFEVRIYCYEGIEYFATWNNNAFSDPALTGAVIDKETLRPKVCAE